MARLSKDVAKRGQVNGAPTSRSQLHTQTTEKPRWLLKMIEVIILFSILALVGTSLFIGFPMFTTTPFDVNALLQVAPEVLPEPLKFHAYLSAGLLTAIEQAQIEGRFNAEGMQDDGDIGDEPPSLEHLRRAIESFAQLRCHDLFAVESNTTSVRYTPSERDLKHSVDILKGFNRVAVTYADASSFTEVHSQQITAILLAVRCFDEWYRYIPVADRRRVILESTTGIALLKRRAAFIEEAIAVHPGDAQLYTLYTTSLLDLHDTKGAVSALAKSLKYKHTDRAALHVALCIAYTFNPKKFERQPSHCHSMKKSPLVTFYGIPIHITSPFVQFHFVRGEPYRTVSDKDDAET